MKIRSKRKKYQKWYHRPWVSALSVILILVLSRAIYLSQAKKQNAEESLRRYEQEYQELQKNMQNIQRDVELLDTERGQEAYLRERYNIRGVNETAIKIIDENKQENDMQGEEGNNTDIE